MHNIIIIISIIICIIFNNMHNHMPNNAKYSNNTINTNMHNI